MTMTTIREKCGDHVELTVLDAINRMVQALRDHASNMRGSVAHPASGMRSTRKVDRLSTSRAVAADKLADRLHAANEREALKIAQIHRTEITILWTLEPSRWLHVAEMLAAGANALLVEQPSGRPYLSFPFPGTYTRQTSVWASDEKGV